MKKMKNCYKIQKKSSVTLNICQTKGLGVSLQFLEFQVILRIFCDFIEKNSQNYFTPSRGLGGGSGGDPGGRFRGKIRPREKKICATKNNIKNYEFTW